MAIAEQFETLMERSMPDPNLAPGEAPEHDFNGSMPMFQDFGAMFFAAFSGVNPEQFADSMKQEMEMRD